MSERPTSTDAADPAADARTAAERLALIDSQTARAADALEPDARVIYGTWGAA